MQIPVRRAVKGVLVVFGLFFHLDENGKGRYLVKGTGEITP